MAAKDRFHAVVRIALEKEQWQITDDPLRLEVGGTKFEIDLGAQQLLAAERDQEKIAVEIKTFLSDSPLTDYHAALGQFLNYRLALEISDPTRILYLAVPVVAYKTFFKREFAQISLERYQIKQIIYDPIHSCNCTMDTIESYRHIIQSLLTDYAAIPIANGSIDCYTVFDLKQDHYQVMNVGWDGHRRVYGCVLHLDIKQGKIWIEQNMTEMRVAQELVDLGVAKEDIVLGFQAPEMRQYTDYAVI